MSACEGVSILIKVRVIFRTVFLLLQQGNGTNCSGLTVTFLHMPKLSCLEPSNVTVWEDRVKEDLKLKLVFWG